MIEVEAPDGTIVEFPADTSREVMRAAMQRRFGQPADMPVPPTPPVPASFGQRLMQGITDLPQGGAQFLTQALPQGLVSGVNDATARVNQMPVVGPITRALGMVPATRDQVQAQTVARENDYQARRAAGGASTGDTDWVRMGGQVLGTLPLGAAAAAGRTIPGAMASGAFTGGVMGGLEPVSDPNANYWESVKGNAESGLMMGAAGGVAGNLLGRALAPSISPQLRQLDRAGVEMTPGQLSGGMLRRLEDSATSFPNNIRAAQQRGVESFNRAAANEVLAPLGSRLAPDVPAGRDLVQAVERQIGEVYDNAISRVQPFGPDQQFAQDIAAASQQFLTPRSRAAFNDIMRDRIASRLGAQIDGKTARTIDSDLGRLGRNYGGSIDVAEREVGSALNGVRDAFRDLIERSNPTVAPDLQAANAAYARFVRLQRAAGSTGAVDGVFTPAQMSRAVQQSDPSARRGRYAAGEALMQEFSDAGRSVLPSTVPNSGTADRAITAALLGAPGGAAAMGVVDPTTALAMMLMSAAYSRPGSRAIQSATMAERPLAAQLLGRSIMRTGAGAPAALALTGSP